MLFMLLSLIGVIVVGGSQRGMGQEVGWFEDVSGAVGLDSVPAWRLYVADVDGDRYPDLVIINGINKRGQLSLWRNVADPSSEDPADRMFVDMTEESGINANTNPEITDGRVADVGALADVDNDGDVDLVTARFYYSVDAFTMEEDRAAVMLNDGTGHFTHLQNNGLDNVDLMNATGLAFLDYDLDGNLDLYVGTFSINHQANIYQSDMLFRGNGDGTFSDVSSQSGIESVSQPLYGTNVADWNNDGWPDVITSPYCRTGGSLWMNNGDGTFTDVASAVGYSAQNMGGDGGQTLCQWEGMPADFDNDGDFDILQVMVHGGYGLTEGRTVIAVNQGEESGYGLTWDLQRIRRNAPNSSHLGDMSGSWIDIDNDGRLDLVINQSQYPQANGVGVERSYVLMQNEENRFDDVTAALGLDGDLVTPGASEVIDYDLDGDDDLFIVVNTNRNRNNTLRLLENRIGTDNSFVTVALDPPGGVNRDAIGARILVTAGGVTQMQEVAAGAGHFAGQQPLVRNFGLGEATSIDRVEVRWPGLGVPNTIIESPSVNSLVTVSGASSVRVAADGPQNHMTAQPQPVSSEFHVDLEPTTTDRTWRLVDLTGRTVLTGTIRSGNGGTVVPVINVPAGRYLFLVEEGDGILTGTRPVIVQH